MRTSKSSYHAYKQEIRLYRTVLDAEITRIEDQLSRTGLTEYDRRQLISVRKGIDFAIASLHDSFPQHLDGFVPERLSPDTPIESLGLSSRARRVLSKIMEVEGFRTLKDLAQYTEERFLCYRYCGLGTAREIRQLLNSAGLDCKDEK
ncbi:MAG: hypothetical protein HY512_03905 [Candidatus Aenigmarchaeota archaeon]|nr:hypothetical protein [Candidatus Aenigmarchaeota archaeon]